MPNREIYGNTDMHKNYLKTKAFIKKKQFPAEMRLISNTLIQLHFDYTYANWYPNLKKKYINKLQVSKFRVRNKDLKMVRYFLGVKRP